MIAPVRAKSSCLFAAAAVAALVAAGPASAQNNVLSANQDAIFNAVKSKRTALLEKMSPVTDATLFKPADGDWLAWRRSTAALGHSPLKQINKANVKTLGPAWSFALAPSGNEITPLVHDGVMFILSANTVTAFDAATGDQLWQYLRPLPAALNNGRTANPKTMAIYGDRLFAPTPDGHIVALEARTGKLVWDHQVLGEAENKARVTLNGGPIVAKGKVIMGATGCTNYKGGCFIFALDSATGNEAWRFHTIAQPGEPGGDTWNNTPADERFGGSVWTSGSYDPELNLVYFGVGNLYQTGALLTPRPGTDKLGPNDGLYTASTVAINPDTGKLMWHYQHVNREVWDLDWVFERELLNTTIKGKPQKLVITGGKIALFDGVDRTNGQYVLSADAGLQTLITGIDPKTGKKTINPALTPEPGVKKHLCPHSGGGRNWPATSIDPASKIMYLQLFETCQDFSWNPRPAADAANGGNDMQWVLKPLPNSDGKFGRVQAINLETGKTVWTQRRRAAFASSTLVTDGGLLFVGSRDRFFYAYDAANGKALWRTRLPASPSATPITYSVGGTQYVAVVAGNGGPVAWPFMTPEIENPTGGTTLMVFKLPDAKEVVE